MQTQTQNPERPRTSRQIQQTVEALKSDSSLARFEFRAAIRWIKGGHNRSTIQGFYGAGSEDTSRAPSRSVSTTVSRRCCSVTTKAPTRWSSFSTRSPAASRRPSSSTPTARGMKLREVSTELEGDIDVQGLLDLDPDAAVGYEEIRIKMHVEGRRLGRGDRGADRVHEGALARVQHGLPPGLGRSSIAIAIAEARDSPIPRGHSPHREDGRASPELAPNPAPIHTTLIRPA